ncbi:MAG TPA: VOC family protein [Chloroflexi bacterium]|jgi:catechol 2,3-dioxygenase|nr:VOC family protein [Chloroflexota bacterium]
MTQPLDPRTKIGSLALTVSDLDRSLAFYEQTLGFQRLDMDRERQIASLGVDGTPLVHLAARSGARAVRRAPGLYHFAIRLPDRHSLAWVIYRLANLEAGIQGVADHGVSEAIYLADPDLNGIEIYRDRPREEWPLTEEGELDMVTDPLDLESLLGELGGRKPGGDQLPAGTDIGHIHLKVSDVQEAARFYQEIIGLELMQTYGDQAAFLSAGGYHHHVGINEWTSKGAPPPPDGSAGLRWFELRLASPEDQEAVLARARAAGLEPQELPGGWLVRDPSQNGVLLRAG